MCLFVCTGTRSLIASPTVWSSFVCSNVKEYLLLKASEQCEDNEVLLQYREEHERQLQMRIKVRHTWTCGAGLSDSQFCCSFVAVNT